MIYEGIVEAFSESGTEGIIWCLIKGTRPSDQAWAYEDLIHLENGDHLTIYDKEIFEKSSGQERVIVWEGTIDFELTSHQESNGLGYTGQAILGLWCHGLQKTRCPEQWALYFFRNYPATLKRVVKDA